MGEGVGGLFAGEGAGRGRGEGGQVGRVVEAGGLRAEERLNGAFGCDGEELEERRGGPRERYSGRHGGGVWLCDALGRMVRSA